MEWGWGLGYMVLPSDHKYEEKEWPPNFSFSLVNL